LGPARGKSEKSKNASKKMMDEKNAEKKNRPAARGQENLSQSSLSLLSSFSQREDYSLFSRKKKGKKNRARVFFLVVWFKLLDISSIGFWGREDRRDTRGCQSLIHTRTRHTRERKVSPPFLFFLIKKERGRPTRRRFKIPREEVERSKTLYNLSRILLNRFSLSSGIWIVALRVQSRSILALLLRVVVCA